MSIGIYCFGKTFSREVLFLYIVVIRVFIFFWVMGALVINLLLTGGFIGSSFRRASFGQIEFIFLSLASLIVVVLRVMKIEVLREYVNRLGPLFLGFESIDISGRQWYWSYGNRDKYFDSYISSIVNVVDKVLNLKYGYLYKLKITSADVIHSFRLPSANLKIDAVPGRIKVVYLVADRVGQYMGYCREFCGAGHSYMPIVVNVLKKE